MEAADGRLGNVEKHIHGVTTDKMGYSRWKCPNMANWSLVM